MLTKPDYRYPDELEAMPANEPALADDLLNWASVVSSIEAEQALIGGLLLDPGPIHDVMDVVSEGDFFKADHRYIFAAMAALVDTSSQIDVISVAEKLQSAGHPTELPYLVDLAGNATGSSNAIAYAKIVFDRSIKRQVLAAVTKVNQYVLKTTDASAEEVVNMAQTALVELNDRSSQSTRSVTAAEALRDYVKCLKNRMEGVQELQGFSSGFPNVDETTNGWKRGHLIVIAGRPSMGKTTYALQMAAHMSVFGGLNGLIFSLEMSQDELMEKMVACIGRIQLESLQNPREVRDEEFWPHVEKAAGLIRKAPLQIVECPGIHINQLKSYARKVHRKQPLDFIMLDHMHIMEADGQSRERQISSISGGCKNLAGELQCSFFALAQLNRKAEDRRFEERAPRMSDLRDSGSVEQDADIIELIYRADYYQDNPHEHNRGLVQVETAKNRNGKKGIHTFINRFDMSRMDVAARGVYIDTNPPRKAIASKRFDDL